MAGDPSFSRAGQPGSPPAPEPPAEEPRTETTLTTRISFTSIPGSRPIPPVVVRSPMPGAEGEERPSEPTAPPGPRHRSGSGSSPVIGVMDSANGTGPMPDLPPEWRTAGQGAPTGPAAAGSATSAEPEAPSTWFVPRKTAAPAPVAPQAQAQTQAPAQPQQSAPPAPTPPQAPYEQQQPYGQQAYPQPGYEQPGLEPQAFEPQAFEQPGFEQPVYQQQPYGRADSPYQQPEYQPPTAPARPAGSGRPSGMNSGLIVGGDPGALDATMPLAMLRDPAPQAPAPQAPAPQQPSPQAQPPFPQSPSPAQAQAQTQAQTQAPARAPEAPAGPAGLRRPVTPKPSPRGPGAASRPKGGAAEQAPARPAKAAQPRVPDGFAGGTGGAGAPPRKETTDTPATSAPAAAKSKGKGKAARGRKLLVTATALLVLAAGVTYGAGLMLNQADVPKGTTVLGQNIGGDTRDAAVHALDGTVGVLAAKPLRVSIGGRVVELQTSVAGLSIDTTATVQSVAKHDYNPVNVVGSLFGGDHPVTPVTRIDTAKLRSALQTLSGGVAGAAREGSVSFTSSGEVVTTLPEAGHALDITTSVNLVKSAYVQRAAGFPDSVIVLPVTASEPKATAAAVNAAAKSIGAWAVKSPSFTLTVHGVTQAFGKITFSKALTLRPDASGALVPVFDLAKLKDVYGNVFDHVKIKHDGVSGPVTPQDIATALTELLGKPGGSRSMTLT